MPSEHHNDGTFKDDHNYVRLKQQPVPRAAGQVFHDEDGKNVGGDDDRNQLMMMVRDYYQIMIERKWQRELGLLTTWSARPRQKKEFNRCESCCNKILYVKLDIAKDHISETFPVG